MSSPAILESSDEQTAPGESTAQTEPGATAEAAAPPAPPATREAQLTDLGMAFRRVFRSFNRLRGRDTHLGASELSHAQFELLIELHERGELAAGELATAARLTPATVTQMLDHLAEQGHVERVRSQTDRRVVVSRLTRQGRRAIEAKREAWKSRWEQALAGLEIDELRAATRVLERLAAMVEDAPAQESCGAREEHPDAPGAAGRKPV
ncbi:MAG: MarR family winged helix-turn-helix transcriptional regulator [Solirubrobacteraceae bacterium]